MYIASVSSTVKFHEFPNGNVIHNYQPGKVEGPIRSISWSKDGNWLLVVPYSGQTEIVSTKDQLKLLKTIHEVNEPTSACFQNTTKKNIGIGTKSGLVMIYDIKSRNVKKRFPRASSQITHIAFTAKDTHCVAGCENGDVLIYNNVTNSPPANLRVPKSNSITSLKTNNLKRNLVMGGSKEGIIVVWDININRSKFCAEAHKASINSVAFSPVNSDLIVTAGADRQFCFYDIADNKCIASISVENSITAVDFSPDGTYFVTASQNGHVYVYDSRNIQEPVHSFLAHKSSIRHVAFQNVQESNNSSMCSLSSESLLTSASIDNVTKRRTRSVRTSEIFGTFIPSAEPSPVEQTSVGSVDGGDSFMMALGLDKNFTDSVKHNDSVFIKENSRLPSIHDTEPSLPAYSLKVDKTEPDDSKPKQFSSTPKFNFQNRSELSPNIASNSLTTNEIKSIVKDLFNEEFKSVVSDLKNDIKYQGTHITYQLRTMLLDMQMAMVKEFIKLENYNNRLREDICPNVNYDTNLMEENERLRKHIQFLEEQLKNLTTKKEDE